MTRLPYRQSSCEDPVCQISAKSGVARRRMSRRAELVRRNHYAGIAPFLEDLQKEANESEARLLRACILIQTWWRRRCRDRLSALSEPNERSRSLDGWSESPLCKQKDVYEDEGFQMPSMPWPSRSSFDWFTNMPSPFSGEEETPMEESFPSASRYDPAFRNPVNMPRQVLILFSDTGGGHRASALALQDALTHLYNRQKEQVSISIIDFIREATPYPWCNTPELYQVAGQYPSVYKMIWEIEGDTPYWRDSNAFKMIWWSSKEKIMEFLEPRLKEERIDLLISVHPLINHVVMEAIYELEERKTYVIPRVVTVVTDLGSAHPSWFEPRIDLLFVPSLELQKLAEDHGLANNKIVLSGLPLRGGFWKEDLRSKQELQKLCGFRQTEPGNPEIVLVMGGGEGFGAILSVAQAVGEMLARRGRDGQLVVVCGRNEEAKSQLENYKWPCAHVGKFLAHILGFVPNIHEYMGAADCLVTKAGPGTIAEAMIKGLPCMLTSFVPGQEEGNISIVTKNGAGLYIPDTEPERIAKELETWLDNSRHLRRMSDNARRLGRPNATLDIARRIGDGLMNLGVEMEMLDLKRISSEAPDQPSRENSLDTDIAESSHSPTDVSQGSPE